METSGQPRILAADRLLDGLVIKFDNGKCGFYTTAYLFAKLAENEQLDENKVAW